MRVWAKERGRLAVVGVVVASLLVGTGVWAVAEWMLPYPDRSIDCEVIEVESFEQAAPAAQACGIDVEVLSERTPWQSSWSTATGETRVLVTTVPSRTLIDGEWVDLDPTIVVSDSAGSDLGASSMSRHSAVASMASSQLLAQDEMLEVSAPVFPIELNPGGLAGRGEPLGRIEKDGHQLEVWFPVPLPQPSIEGSRVVYDLGEGVRLFVTVNVSASGFIPVVELASPAALTHFQQLLDSSTSDSGSEREMFSFNMAAEASEGLSFRQEGNSVEVVDSVGDVQFHAMPPIMWDSAAGGTAVAEDGDLEAVDRTVWPAEGDTIAEVGLSYASDVLVLTPDEEMLSDPTTVWPVYIDPQITGKTPTDWVAVRSGGYTNTIRQWGDMTSGPGQGTGYCSTTSSCNVQFKQRLAWEFSGLSFLDDVEPSDINKAWFIVDGVHSAYCTAQTTTLQRSSDVGASNTFSNLTWHETAGTRTEYHRAGCSPTNVGPKSFNALALAQWGATNNQTTLRMGLRVNEASINYWKRFQHDAELEIYYNRPPSAPTQLMYQQAGGASCTTVEPYSVMNVTTPILSALVSDPDGQSMTANFRVEYWRPKKGGDPGEGEYASLWTTTTTATTATGQRVSVAVPAAELEDLGLYRWRVRATDTATSDVPARTGPYSSYCYFRVDTTSPPGPSIEPITDDVQAVYLEGMQSGGAELLGKFEFAAGADSDAVRFSYSFLGNAQLTPVAGQAFPDANGRAVVSFTPNVSSPVTLLVTSTDAAGNQSIATSYEFTVAAPIEDAVWTLDEGSGPIAEDSFSDEANVLSIFGADWAIGPHSEFQSRQGDTSLLFDGSSDHAVSELPVVDTANSFVVSAHVKLADQTSLAAPMVRTILSQDGVTASAFQLQYVPACVGTNAPCWSFTMPGEQSGASPSTVTSPSPVRMDEWVHLVAQYSANSDQLTLWTCDIGTPDQPTPAVPSKSTAAHAGTPWTSGGVLAVGRGLEGAIPTNWWQGEIDNVRIFTGEVVDETKVRRLCQGAEASDFAAGEIALDPTVEGE